MTGIGCILWSQCWACQFDSHYDKPTAHTWMDEEDAEHAGVPFVLADLATSHPCGCSRCGTVRSVR